MISIDIFLLVLIAHLYNCVDGYTGSMASSNNLMNSLDQTAINLLIALLVMIYVYPVCLWVYRNYLDFYVTKAMKKVEELQERVSERMSSAGRKVSESMRV